MMVGESEKRSQQTLCRLLGYSRQAYYKGRRQEEREAIKTELVVREVVRIRGEQKRIGVKKLHYMLESFRRDHGIKMGRDQLNEKLGQFGLLVRKRRRRKPRTTFSSPWKRYPNLVRDVV